MTGRKLLFAATLTSSAALAGACFEPALETDEELVIGGSPSSPGEFPGVGALMYDFGGQSAQGCTGTLIAPDAVLTAAHCVDPELTGPGVPGFSLALDTLTGETNTVAGSVAYKHESFSLDGEPIDGLSEFFDIGVVILSQPITSVPPVRMIRPDQAPLLAAGLDLAIVGYGKTTTSSDTTGVMFDAMTKLISLNSTEIQVGMGTPQPQNCQGDSGGPALADFGDGRRAVGVVSRSYSGFECTMGGVDTRVDAYLTWIHGKVPTGIPCGSGMSAPCEGEEDPDDEGGCCSAGSRGAPGAGLMGLLVGMALLRPRRRRS